MIKTRVIEEGKDAKGGEFPPYSTKPMLVGDKSFRKKDSSISLIEMIWNGKEF